VRTKFISITLLLYAGSSLELPKYKQWWHCAVRKESQLYTAATMMHNTMLVFTALQEVPA